MNREPRGATILEVSYNGKFAINTLEFTKVREKLSQYAGTAMGQRLAMELMSSSRFEEVKLSQEETAEAVRILDEGTTIPLGGDYRYFRIGETYPCWQPS